MMLQKISSKSCSIELYILYRTLKEYDINVLTQIFLEHQISIFSTDLFSKSALFQHTTAETVLLCHHWFSSATKSDLRRLRRVVRTAERIIGTTLPTLQVPYSSRLRKRAGKITLDPSHPAHSLFKLLPSGRRYRAQSTRTTRHRNSFVPQAIHLINT